MKHQIKMSGTSWRGCGCRVSVEIYGRDYAIFKECVICAAVLPEQHHVLTILSHVNVGKEGRQHAT